MKLRNLSILTGALFIISLFVYSNENRRGTDLVTGSEFIKGININAVEKIEISAGGSKKVSFVKDGNRFVLESHQSFPASNEKVNNLIFSISNILIQEKVENNASEDDLARYGLSDEKSNIRVEFFDEKGKSTLAFRIGNNHQKRGTYIMKEGGDKKDVVYLSQNSIWINSNHHDFINKSILDVDTKEISEIVINDIDDKKILKVDNEYKLAADDSKQVKKEELEKIVRTLKNVRLKDFYSREDDKVKNLNFQNSLKIKLKNEIIYKLSLSKDNEKHFVSILGNTENIPRNVTLSSNDGKEEIQKVEDMIRAQGSLQQFNLDRANWVYEVDKSTYENLAKNVSDIL